MTEFRIQRIPNLYRIPVPKPETPESYSRPLPALELVKNSNLLTAHEPCKLPKSTEFRILKIPNIDFKTEKNEPLAEPRSVTNSDSVIEPVTQKLPKLVKLRQNLSRVQSEKKKCGCCACSHAHSGKPFIADWPFMLKYEDQVNLTKYCILFP